MDRQKLDDDHEREGKFYQDRVHVRGKGRDTWDHLTEMKQSYMPSQKW